MEQEYLTPIRANIFVQTQHTTSAKINTTVSPLRRGPSSVLGLFLEKGHQ
jgi:hypothetical protein